MSINWYRGGPFSGVREGVKWAVVEAADTLDGLRAPLESALAKVALEAREAQATLADKAAAMDGYD